MGLLRTLEYWLGGGKRRWFVRKAKLLPVLAQQGNLLGGALFEALSVGLDVDPDRALGLVLAVDPHATEAYTTQVAESDRQDILRRAARMASGPAWRIGWTIATRLKQPDQLTTFGRGLALHCAREGNAGALVMHLDDCRDAGLLDRELIDDVVREAHRSVQDDPSWRLCLSGCHEDLGDLFAALQVCPATQQERRLGLIERVRRSAFEAAERGESSNAMTAVTKLQEVLADDPGPAWQIGWTIAKRLKQQQHLKTFGRGLALHWARAGKTEALVVHVDDCRDAGSIDRDLLGDLVRELAAHRGLGDDPSWRLCLSCCHEHLGELPEALRTSWRSSLTREKARASPMTERR